MTVTVVFEGQRTRCEPLVLDGASLDRGARKLHGEVLEPGVLFGCQFDRLDVEVSERAAGADLWVHVTRRLGKEWRLYLTDRARPLANAQVLAAVGTGFGDVWAGRFVGSRAANIADDAKTQADTATRIASWWRCTEAVARALADGELRVDLYDATRIGDRPPSVIVPAQWRGQDTERVTLAGDLVNGAGVVVGHLSDGGRVLSRGTQLD